MVYNSREYFVCFLVSCFVKIKMKVDNTQLYDYLSLNALVSREILTPLFTQAQQGGTQLSDLLLSQQVLSEKVLVEVQSKMFGFPYVDLSKIEILEQTLHIIPEQIARKASVIAFAKKGNDLSIAMTNPEDLQTLDFLRKKTNLNLDVHIATSSDIKTILHQYEKTLKAEFGDLLHDEEQGESLAEIAEDLPIVRIVDTLVKHAILQGASDIHIEPLEKSVIVRYRVDGILRQAMSLPKNTLSGIVARIKVLANLKLDEHRLPQDGRFKMETDEYKISFRVSILPVFDGEKVVMRLLDEGSQGLTLEKMGLFGGALEVIHREINKPNGMILVTGPTGSGKTTTLYTVLDILNQPEVNISTVEDPVEYRMENVNQTQVHAKIGMTFAAGLRSLLRQDPDMIMVGEIRDKETLEIAIHAAMTGHLVLSTLHTNSAAGAIPRMVDMGAEPFLIASTTNMVIGQRLVRKICDECRQEYKLTPKELQTLRGSYDMDSLLATMIRLGAVQEGQTWTELGLYKAVGCGECGNLGYKGRRGIYEVFEVEETVEKLIVENATSDALEKAARQMGMITMVEDGFFKALGGVTTVEEILRVTKE